jgi:hypothetical protein
MFKLAKFLSLIFFEFLIACMMRVRPMSRHEHIKYKKCGMKPLSASDIAAGLNWKYITKKKPDFGFV